MQDWDVAVAFFKEEKVRVLPGLVFPGVYWDKNPENYQDRRLLQWHKRLENVKELYSADVVLSDNLTQVLHYRRDAVLLGSFLWSDILEDAYPNNPFIQAFVEEERALLTKHTPFMLCVRDIVMPGVTSQAKAVPLPWFCEGNTHIRKRGESEERYKIALLGGATDSITNELEHLAVELSHSKDIEIFLPKELWAKFGGENIKIFDHAASSFASLDLIVCRPGVGTLTDGVCYGVPIASIHEAGNIEMTHNGQMVEQLQIGINLGTPSALGESKDKIVNFLASAAYKQSKEKILTRPKDGVNASVNWLVNHLKQLV